MAWGKELMGYRRKKFSYEQQEKQKDLNDLDGKYVYAAMYCRLSVENEEATSIENQKRIIKAYIEKHPEIKLVGSYADNGVTGTLFDRPQWKTMMREAARGKIQCILVKDLSRFGRNYTETGYYLEHIFPKLGIRLVAVNDEFDTETLTDMLPVQIKNIVNDMYARDVSRKLSFIFDRQRKNGDLVRAAPFGYRYEGKQLVADRDTAPIVRMIFTWYAMGVTITEIRDRLGIMGVQPPSDLKKGVKNKLSSEHTIWSHHTIRRLLTDRKFTGTFVSGQIIIRMHKRISVSEDQWTIIEGHHEAVVSQELFDAVQEKLKETVYHPRVGGYHKILDGKFFCALCGGRMQLSHGGHEKWKRYSCRNHKGIPRTRGVFEQLDKSPAIAEREILELIDDACETFEPKFQAIRQMLIGAFNIGGVMEKPESDAVKAKKAYDRALTLRDTLYEDYTNHEIDLSTYMAERDNLGEKIREKEKELHEAVMRKNETETLIETAKGAYREDTELSDLIEKILYYPDGTITVTFRLADELSRLMEEMR